jgi:hypothetical protein
MASPDDFRAWDSGPLTAAERDRLLGLLGRYGIGVGAGAARAGRVGGVEGSLPDRR